MLCSSRLMVRDRSASCSSAPRENNSLKLARVCVCVCVWSWRPETFSLVQFLTVPQIISWLRQKASPVRNRPHNGVDVHTVLSSKSYWHLHPTVFLSNGHSGWALPHTRSPGSPGQAVYPLTAQNLEGFAPIKLILNYCCSAQGLHACILVQNIWVSCTPQWGTISSEPLCLPRCHGSVSPAWVTGFHSLSWMYYGYLWFCNRGLRIKVLWEFQDKRRLKVCQEVECILVNCEKGCDSVGCRPLPHFGEWAGAHPFSTTLSITL